MTTQFLFMVGSEYHDNYIDSYCTQATEDEIHEWLEDEEYGLGSPYYYSLHGPVHPDSYVQRTTHIPVEYKQPTIGDILNLELS